jgi:hypothetical protein
MGGLILYGVYYALHVRAVALHRQVTDLVQTVSWIQFGGMPFVLTTFGTNGLLHNRPLWLAALAFAVIAAGMLSRELPVHLRGAVVVYLAAFAIAGQPFNWYWGWLTGFITPLAFASGVGALPALVSTAFVGPSTPDHAAAVSPGAATSIPAEARREWYRDAAALSVLTRPHAARPHDAPAMRRAFAPLDRAFAVGQPVTTDGPTQETRRGSLWYSAPPAGSLSRRAMRYSGEAPPPRSRRRRPWRIWSASRRHAWC